VGLGDVSLHDLQPAVRSRAGGRRHARLHERGHLCAAVDEAVREPAADEARIPGEEDLPVEHAPGSYRSVVGFGPSTTLSEVLEPRLENRPCGGKYGDIVQAIGNTPLVELRRFSPKPGVRIYAKLESYNPTGSVKDRVARSMIEQAEEDGLISPGQTILEPTSGNTGISLAMICSRKGYPLKVVMPDNVTEERTQLLRMYGAEIVYSPGEQGSNGAVAKALDMAEADHAYYMPYQYGNQANPDAHYHGTAVEILEELDEVSAFVGGLGTGGTLMGNARRLKEENEETVVVAAEPLQGELVQGLRSLEDGYIPPILDLTLLDRKIFVSNRDAVVWTKKLVDEEGLFVGVSSGAIAAIAVRVAGKLDEGNVVFVAPDDGWKYLSSGVYTKTVEQLEDEGVLDSASFW
jgi:cysteine synthase B